MVHYLLTDQLGSTAVTADPSGTQEARQWYYPFGGPRANVNNLPTDRRFTGQRSEEATLGSLYDFVARPYSPTLGRFLAPDSIVPEPGNPQSLNRYAYVFNRPTVLNDPSGRCPICIILGLAALAAAVDTFAVPDTAYAPELTTDLAALPPSAAPPEKHALAIGGTVVGGRVALWALEPLVMGACADGDCTNGLGTADQALEQVNKTVPNAVAKEVILNSEWTVLGRYPAYVEKAKQLGANFFNIPAEEWQALGSRAAQWARNKEYLDQAMASGQSFRLATSFKSGMEATQSFYHDELVYLLQQGYELVILEGQEWLIKAAATVQ